MDKHNCSSVLHVLITNANLITTPTHSTNGLNGVMQGAVFDLLLDFGTTAFIAGQFTAGF